MTASAAPGAIDSRADLAGYLKKQVNQAPHPTGHHTISGSCEIASFPLPFSRPVFPDFHKSMPLYSLSSYLSGFILVCLLCSRLIFYKAVSGLYNHRLTCRYCSPSSNAPQTPFPGNLKSHRYRSIGPFLTILYSSVQAKCRFSHITSPVLKCFDSNQRHVISWVDAARPVFRETLKLLAAFLQ